MARIRTIKPEFFTSLTISALSPQTRLTFIGLWTHVDDDGRCIDNAALIKAAVWPLERTPDAVEKDLSTLATVGLIHRYEVDGRGYLRISAWLEHQVINRPRTSKLPPPPDREESWNVQ